jgi:GT2 family glycosyltransferase
MITAILNGYRRPENLDLQVHALQAQTLLPTEIMVWYNHPGAGFPINHNVSRYAKCAYSNSNLGVWARFTFALNATTEFICIFDDDTIPGPKWFENCLDQMRRQEALLGTVGLLYTKPPPPDSPDVSYHNHYTKYGWHPSGINNVSPVEVDFVGHAWFFKREWLSVFWRELPNPKYILCGEDMHFSYMLQKYLGIPTMVPPHPAHQKELWGSFRGMELGSNSESLWESNPVDQSGQQFRLAMNEFFIMQRRNGWRLVNDNR